MSMVAVAERAKVSIATVSRVLNGTAKVSPATAERVRKAMTALNFFPDENARALGSGRSNLYGLIISDIVNPYFPELVKAFEDIAFEHGQDILIANTNYDPQRMEACVNRMLRRRVDGVAIMTSEMEDRLLKNFSSRKIPMVFMDIVAPVRGMSAVRVDYASGIRAAMDYFYQLGHTRIAFLSGPRGLASARVREEAFRQCVAERGSPVDERLVQEGDHRASGGRLAMERVLAVKRRPTAVLASNDLTAIGAMGAIHDAGLRIPDDLSIIGIDDIALSTYTLPPLTTLQVSRRDLAATAFACLYQCRNGPLPARPLAREHIIEARLIVRSSTAAPKPAAGISI